MSDFKEGDVVKLKSGSLPMTISEFGVYSGKRKAVCKWFDENNKPQRMVYELHILEKYERPKQSDVMD